MLKKNGKEDQHRASLFSARYRLGPEIGRGGFGVVFAGVRIGDGLPVAVKFVHSRNVTEWTSLADSGSDSNSSSSSSSGAKTMQKRRMVPLEIVLLERCSVCPGVARLLEWFERFDGFLLVMERLVSGCDLFEFISDWGALNETLARFFFKQIFMTTMECSVQGILHRDIKEENIIVNRETGHLKLIDFGSGAFLKSTEYTDFQGTRVYAPPEWILYGHYDGLKTTVWSLGIFLYGLVMGDLPFRRDSEICSAVLKWPRPVSDSCRNLIRHCLDPCPDTRLSLDEIAEYPWMLMGSEKENAMGNMGILYPLNSPSNIPQSSEIIPAQITSNGESMASESSHPADCIQNAVFNDNGTVAESSSPSNTHAPLFSPPPAPPHQSAKKKRKSLSLVNTTNMLSKSLPTSSAILSSHSPQNFHLALLPSAAKASTSTGDSAYGGSGAGSSYHYCDERAEVHVVLLRSRRKSFSSPSPLALDKSDAAASSFAVSEGANNKNKDAFRPSTLITENELNRTNS